VSNYMDALAIYEIAEARNRILNPIGDRELLRLGAATGIGPGGRVLDLGCGKAELLCRWAEAYGCGGEGVDLSPVFLAAGRARADELGVADRVILRQADASTYRPATAGYDVGVCLGATWIGGGTVGMIGLLRRWTRPGGLVVIGEPYWAQPPTDEARAALGIAPGRFASLDGLQDRFAQAGMEAVEQVLAGESGWERYRSSHWRVLEGRPDDSLTETLRAFRDRERARHETYGPRFLNWAAFVLRPVQ